MLQSAKLQNGQFREGIQTKLGSAACESADIPLGSLQQEGVLNEAIPKQETVDRRVPTALGRPACPCGRFADHKRTRTRKTKLKIHPARRGIFHLVFLVRGTRAVNFCI